MIVLLTGRQKTDYGSKSGWLLHINMMLYIILHLFCSGQSPVCLHASVFWQVGSSLWKNRCSVYVGTGGCHVLVRWGNVYLGSEQNPVFAGDWIRCETFRHSPLYSGETFKTHVTVSSGKSKNLYWVPFQGILSFPDMERAHFWETIWKYLEWAIFFVNSN